MSEEVKERQAKCTYFGAKTHRMKKYACCGCDACSKAMPDGNTGKCACIVKSDPKLAFFKAEPEKDFDSYFCGCLGWD